jgi:hypothetical protein
VQRDLARTGVLSTDSLPASRGRAEPILQQRKRGTDLFADNLQENPNFLEEAREKITRSGEPHPDPRKIASLLSKPLLHIVYIRAFTTLGVGLGFE